MFEKLNAINVNDKTEKKDGLTYLSWAWAWGEFKKVYPDATYQIRKFSTKDDMNSTLVLPYMFDEKTGYMVSTEVTADGLTYEMWLPVMDNKNKAMLSEPYTNKTSKGYEYTVQKATMFDINKAIMRCLVKNLAMFGLGLYIYAGEDLPEGEEKQETTIIEKIEKAPEYKCNKCGKTISKGAYEHWNGLCATCKKEVNNEVQE